METKGKTILKVVGILFIIFGAIGVIIYALGLLGLGAFAIIDGTDASSTAIILSMLIYLIWSVIELIAGILGVKNRANPSKAGTLFTFGVILLVFAVASAIFGMITIGISANAIISLVGGVVLPIIFIYGAKKNMSA